MWYAVNPNYEWAHAFFSWCSKKDHTQMQISITSEYAPIRLWRVLFQTEDACFTSPTGPYCTGEVAAGFPLNIAAGIPAVRDNITHSVFDASFCRPGGTFDLWVESLEYFDPLNIAVSVRRGSVQSVMALYFGETTSDLGHTVTYFVSIQNTSRVRMGSPWTTPEQFPVVIWGSAVLCQARPAQAHA